MAGWQKKWIRRQIFSLAQKASKTLSLERWSFLPEWDPDRTTSWLISVNTAVQGFWTHDALNKRFRALPIEPLCFREMKQYDCVTSESLYFLALLMWLLNSWPWRKGQGVNNSQFKKGKRSWYIPQSLWLYSVLGLWKEIRENITLAGSFANITCRKLIVKSATRQKKRQHQPQGCMQIESGRAQFMILFFKIRQLLAI